MALLQSETLLILLQISHHLLSLLSQTLNLLILRLLELQHHVLGQLEFAIFFSQLLFLKLDLDNLVFDHLALFFSQFDFFPLEFIFSLAERAFHDFSNVNCALLNPVKDLTKIILLSELRLESRGLF